MATITVVGMFLTGTHAARPAASAVGKGTLYSCTDHALIYQTTDGANWTTWLTAGVTSSFGSNVNAVGEANAPGAHASNSRADHVHLGVRSVSHSSNTFSGPVTLTASGVLGITSPTPGTFNLSATGGSGSGSGGVTVADEGTPLATTGTTLDFVGAGVVASGTGATKTITIAGGGGTFPLGLAAPDKIPSSPGAEDEEFEGTADTLPTDWAWVSAAPTFNLNSYYPSWFIIERSDTTERKLRKSNFTMAATSGLWIKFGNGTNNGTTSQFEFIIYDSASSNGYGFGIHNGNVAVARDSNAGSLVNRGTWTIATGHAGHIYMGVMRVSDTWQTWFSYDGIHWEETQSADTRAFTVDRLELRWSSDTSIKSRGSVDWIRYRADNEFPRP